MAGCFPGDLEFRRVAGDGSESLLQLDAGQWRAQAVVDAAPVGHVGVVFSGDIELGRLGEALRIAVGCAQEQAQLRAAFQRVRCRATGLSDTTRLAGYYGYSE